MWEGEPWAGHAFVALGTRLYKFVKVLLTIGCGAPGSNLSMSVASETSPPTDVGRVV